MDIPTNQMIEELVDNDIKIIKQNIEDKDLSFLESILLGYEFKGYLHLSDTEILNKYNKMKSKILKQHMEV